MVVKPYTCKFMMQAHVPENECGKIEGQMRVETIFCEDCEDTLFTWKVWGEVDSRHPLKIREIYSLENLEGLFFRKKNT